MASTAFSYAARSFASPTLLPAPLRWPTPLDLAAELTPFDTIRTPALELINQAVMDALSTPGGRLIISTPPQEGKTSAVTLAVPVWLWLRDPDTRVAVACYNQDLAGEFGGKIRDTLTHHSGSDGEIDLGLRVDQS